MTDIFDHWPAPMARITTRHITVSISWILKARDSELDCMLQDGETKRTLTPAECRAVAIEHMAAGRAYLPPCDHVNPDGSCAGHPHYQLSEKGSSI